MIRFLVVLSLLVAACLEVAHLASLLPSPPQGLQVAPNLVPDKPPPIRMPSTSHEPINTLLPTSPQPPAVVTTSTTTTNVTTTSQKPTSTSSTTKRTTNPSVTSTSSSTSATDSYETSIEPDTTIAGQELTPTTTVSDLPDPVTSKNNTETSHEQPKESSRLNYELPILFYSIFIVYVSFIKIIYHNVAIIKYNLTEPGILMIFGIIWELVARELTSNHEAFPRFNSRILFYLFLPSTVLESASLLSNKWLFINLLPILVHAIIGTVCFAASLGLALYALTRHQVTHLLAGSSADRSVVVLQRFTRSSNFTEDWIPEVALASGENEQSTGNLMLADCLMLGTILSSVDSSTMLSVFRLLHINEKLHYLILGETLLNNAVVLVIYNQLLDFLNVTKLTLSNVYFASLQFIFTLFGSIFIGLLFAAVALASIRLANRLHVPKALTSYQNQCNAIVETLLVLKLGYLSYTIAPLARTSRILSLATFGILHDQYIKHNLNLRSQQTFKQVILATRTMGFSLVYPLLGMLLVDVAKTGEFYATWMAANRSGDKEKKSPTLDQSITSDSEVPRPVDLNWDFRFLAMITVLSIGLRFVIAIIMSLLSNLFSSKQLRINLREQILLAYGGLKAPLAFALVHRLIEHDEYRDKSLHNKHLLMYTVLFIICVSTIIQGSFIWPLVSRMQQKLSQQPAARSGHHHGGQVIVGKLGNRMVERANASIVFEEINDRLVEHVSHGLNSILGRTKSPYDRFVDFNELHIKPWLAGGSSNTNWLSVFYDNLMLDETLNANCFYRSTELAPAAIIKQQYHEEQQKKLFDRQRPGRSDPEASGTPHSGKRGRPEPGSDNTLLKELVMLNLKMDNAKRRRRSTKTSILSRRRVHPSEQVDDYVTSGDRMISSSTSVVGLEPSTSIEMVRKVVAENGRRETPREADTKAARSQAPRAAHKSEPRQQVTGVRHQRTHTKVNHQRLRR